MSSFNKVILCGRLTRNPELTFTATGQAIAKFGLAVNHRFKSGEDLKESVCFVDVTAFGKQAEHCAQYLQKGSAALIEGRLEMNQWEKDGKRHTKHEVVAQGITFMGKKGDHDADAV